MTTGSPSTPATPKEELCLYPERRWCALHTRARHEKKVADICHSLDVPSYLPLRVHRTFSGGKVNIFHLPMFPGYLFAALAPGDIQSLKRTNSVSHRLEPRDEESLLRELTEVSKVERAGVELETVSTFKSGQKVVVTDGPLRGVKGLVVRYKNRTRLQVEVKTIHQALLVDVSVGSVSPI